MPRTAGAVTFEGGVLYICEGPWISEGADRLPAPVHKTFAHTTITATLPQGALQVGTYGPQNQSRGQMSDANGPHAG